MRPTQENESCAVHTHTRSTMSSAAHRHAVVVENQVCMPSSFAMFVGTTAEWLKAESRQVQLIVD